jgi:hypothetical protein
MFEIEKLKIEHLEELAAQPINSHVKAWFDNGHAQAMADFEGTVAGFVKGELMIAAGLMPYWTGRAHIWTLFSEKAKGNFVPVFRGIEKYLRSLEYRRIEMDVPLDSKITEAARRRAMMLGFTLECERAKYYRPNGGDSALYVWLKEHKNV